MRKIAPYERKVYYYETDKMGVMHHSNYIRIFEETRVDYLAQAGLPFDVIEGMGLYMPVLDVSCQYKHPLTFNETFFAELRIEKFNGTTLYLAYTITNKNGDICAVGTSKHCFTDKSMKPVRIKKSHPEIFAVLSSDSGNDEKDQ